VSLHRFIMFARSLRSVFAPLRAPIAPIRLLHASRPALLPLEKVVPNFTAHTTSGQIDFHQWIGNDWVLLVSHPRDFTPVCTTELAELGKLAPEFLKRGVKPIGLSCDKIEKHRSWEKDVVQFGGLSGKLPYPIIADASRDVAKLYGMLDDKDLSPEDNLPQTVRSVFLVDNNKRLRLELVYPSSTGRNWKEVLRAIDSIKLADKHPIATPHGWQPGDEVVLKPSISTEDAKKKYPNIRVVKPYLRFIKQPQD
jgi:alkyl hydroperoxide reductase subunit AhpC